MAEAADSAKTIVTLRFPSSHVDLAKSDYDLVARLLAGLGRASASASEKASSSSTTSLPTREGESDASATSDDPTGAPALSSLALNVFFTQGNWVFREEPLVAGASGCEHANNEPPHRYELEFHKLHIFHLAKHASTVRIQ